MSIEDDVKVATLKLIVEMANGVRKTLKVDFESVRKLVEDHDVVDAVWQDPRKPHGVGTLIVKGGNLLRRTAAGEAPVTARLTAIPTVSSAQAEVLKKIAGERDMRH